MSTSENFGDPDEISSRSVLFPRVTKIQYSLTRNVSQCNKCPQRIEAVGQGHSDLITVSGTL